MCLKARARSLARKEARLSKTRQFKQGTLIENPSYNYKLHRLEQMRKSVNYDYQKLNAAT